MLNPAMKNPKLAATYPLTSDSSLIAGSLASRPWVRKASSLPIMPGRGMLWAVSGVLRDDLKGS